MNDPIIRPLPSPLANKSFPQLSAIKPRPIPSFSVRQAFTFSQGAQVTGARGIDVLSNLFKLGNKLVLSLAHTSDQLKIDPFWSKLILLAKRIGKPQPNYDNRSQPNQYDQQNFQSDNLSLIYLSPIEKSAIDGIISNWIDNRSYTLTSRTLTLRGSNCHRIGGGSITRGVSPGTATFIKIPASNSMKVGSSIISDILTLTSRSQGSGIISDIPAAKRRKHESPDGCSNISATKKIVKQLAQNIENLYLKIIAIHRQTAFPAFVESGDVNALITVLGVKPNYPNRREKSIDQLVKLAKYYQRITVLNIYDWLTEKRIVSRLATKSLDIRLLRNIYGGVFHTNSEALISIYNTGIYDFHLQMGNILRYEEWDIKSVALPAELLPSNIVVPIAKGNLTTRSRGIIDSKKYAEVSRHFKKLLAENCLRVVEKIFKAVNLRNLDPYHSLADNSAYSNTSWIKLAQWPPTGQEYQGMPEFNYLTYQAAHCVTNAALEAATHRRYMIPINNKGLITGIPGKFSYLGDQTINMILNQWEREPCNRYCSSSSRLLWRLATYGINLRNSLPYINDDNWPHFLKLVFIVVSTNGKQRLDTNWYKLTFGKLSWFEQVLVYRTCNKGSIKALFMSTEQMLSELLAVRSNDFSTDKVNSKDILLSKRNIGKYIERYKRYVSMSKEAITLVLKLYKLPLSRIAALPMSSRSKLEPLIIKHQLSFDIIIANQVGMYIPPSVDDQQRYITNNLVYYQPVVDRPACLSPPSISDLSSWGPNHIASFGDQELIRSLNCFPPFDSRKELIIKLYQLLYEEDFFSPPIRRSTNNQTTYLNEVDDYGEFMLAYGTLDKYRMYELAEFDSCFKIKETSSSGAGWEDTRQLNENNPQFHIDLVRSLSRRANRSRTTSSVASSSSSTPASTPAPNSSLSFGSSATPTLSFGSSTASPYSNISAYSPGSFSSQFSRLDGILFAPTSSSGIAGGIYDILRALANNSPVQVGDESNISDNDNIASHFVVSGDGHGSFASILSDMGQIIMGGPPPSSVVLNDERITKLPDHVVKFTRPDKIREEFSTSSLVSLSNLLNEYFTGYSSAQKGRKCKEKDLHQQRRKLMESILSKIGIGLEYRQKMKGFRSDLNKQLRELSAEDGKLTQTWLKMLLQIGMYMRRWKGPGHPYPLEKSATKVKKTKVLGCSQYKRRTTEHLGKLGQLEDEMSDELQATLRNLPAYDLMGGMVIAHPNNIGYYVGAVATEGENSDEACVRVNSTIFIGTAYAYLTFIFDHSIEGLNIKRIAGIQ